MGCGCNSGGWTGSGAYYGGYPSGCSVCGCQGGGWAGTKSNGQPKGGVTDQGIKIYVGSSSTDVVVSYVRVLPAAVVRWCWAPSLAWCLRSSTCRCAPARALLHAGRALALAVQASTAQQAPRLTHRRSVPMARCQPRRSTAPPGRQCARPCHRRTTRHRSPARSRLAVARSHAPRRTCVKMASE